MSSFDTFYREYACSYNSPLNCDRPWQTSQEIKGARFCLECGFPATLSQEAQIKGNSGTYQVNNYLGVRGNGRLYSGLTLKDQQPVVIKEYLLPQRCFNDRETLQRKETFQRVGGVNLADSRIQNFRLVNTLDAIADEKGERCYLITKEIPSATTLSEFIRENGGMTAAQVREFLNQSLQTLEFLHSQKLRFPSNQIQPGLTHGNISLDSILIQLENNQQFYIYLSDLAIWENLFIPPNIPQPAPARRDQDLESLGLVAFYLWVGRTTNFATNQPLDPRDDQQWPNTDSHLKPFLLRLLGLGTPFASAEAARQALLQMPKESQASSVTQLVGTEDTEKLWRNRFIWLLILFFILLGGGIWYYFLSRNSTSESEQYATWRKLLMNFSVVENIPSGKFTYTGEQVSTWSFVLKQKLDDNKQLADILTNPKPEAKAIFQYDPVVSPDVQKPIQSVEEVQTAKKDFAITSLADNITDKLQKKQVAYDGLLVYVAFSKQDANLANKLGGKITLEQLRQIFTKKITNWQQIDPQLPNIDIKPFAPKEPEAVRKFQEIVLKNDAQAKADFEAVSKVETSKIQNQIRNEIQTGQTPGIISFGILSKTWAQCTGYPLAIIDGDKQPSQPLFQRREKRAIKPSDDICQHDDYYFDVKTFQSYPLGYPVYVVYPKDNSRPPAGSTFSELLTTRQGQCLLSKVGLVPLQPIPDDINSYACKSVP